MMTIEDLSEEMTHAQSAIEKFKHQIKKNLRELHSGFEKIVAEDPTFIEEIGTIIKRYFVTEAAANAVAAIADKASNETLGNVFKMGTRFLFVVAFLVKDMSDKSRLDKAKKFVEITSEIGGIDQLSELVAEPLANRLHYLLIGCTDINKLAFFFSGSITRMILNSTIPAKKFSQKMTGYFKKSINLEHMRLVKDLIADNIIPEAESDLYEQKFLFIFSKNITIKYGKEDLELKILLNNSPAIIEEDGSLCKHETDKLKIKRYCWLPAQRLSRIRATAYHDNILPKLEVTQAAVRRNPIAQPSNIDEAQLTLLDEHYHETLTYVKTTGIDKLKDETYVGLAKRLFEVRESLAQVIEDKTAAIIDYLLKYAEVLYLYNYKLTVLQVWDDVDKLFLKKEMQFLEGAVEVLEEKRQAVKLDEISLNWISEHLGKLKILIGYKEAQSDARQIQTRRNKKILDNYSMYLRFLEFSDVNIITDEKLLSTDNLLNELKESNQRKVISIDFHDLDRRLITLIARATKPLINKVDRQWVQIKQDQKKKTLFQLIGSAEAANIKTANTRNLRNLQGILSDLEVNLKDKTIKEITSIGKEIKATADKKTITSETQKQIVEVVTKIHQALLENICKLVKENKIEKLESLLQSLSSEDKSIMLNKIMQDKRLLEHALEVESAEEFYRVAELLIQHGADPSYVIYFKITDEQLKDVDKATKNTLNKFMREIAPADHELDLLYTNKKFLPKVTKELIEKIHNENVKQKSSDLENTEQKFSDLSKLNEREFWLVVSYISGTTVAQRLLLGSTKEPFSSSCYQKLAKYTQDKFGSFYNCLYQWTKIFTGGDALGNILVSHDYLPQHNSIHLMLKALEYPIGTYNESTLFYIIYKNDYYAIDYLTSFIHGLEGRRDSLTFFAALYKLIVTPFVKSNYQDLNFQPHPKMLLTPITLAAYCGNLEALQLFKTIIERYLSIIILENKRLDNVGSRKKEEFLERMRNCFSYDKLGCSALHYAALMTHENVVNWLLEIGVDTSCKTRFSFHSIQQKLGKINCEIDSEKKDLSWLLESFNSQDNSSNNQDNVEPKGNDNNEDDEDAISDGTTPGGISDEDEQFKKAMFQGYTALDYARASNGNVKIIMAIDKNMNEKYEMHKKEFIESRKPAEIFRQARYVLALMPKSGHFNKNKILHKTPYEILAQNPVGYFHVVFDFKAQTTQGDSSLFENIGTIDNEFLKIHLENNKTLVNRTNDCGVTLLMLAIYLKRRDIVETLIGLGANTQISTTKDYTKITKRRGKQNVFIPKGSNALILAARDDRSNALVSQNAEQFFILNEFQDLIEQLIRNKITNVKALNKSLLNLISQITENEKLKPGFEFCIRYTGDTLLHLLLQIYKWTNIRLGNHRDYSKAEQNLFKIASYITDKSLKALFWQHAQFGPIVGNINKYNSDCMDFILTMAIEVFKKSDLDIILSDEHLLKLAVFISKHANNINIYDKSKHTPLQIMARHHLVKDLDEVITQGRDLHLLAELPDNKDYKLYKDSYIWLKNTQKLYYVQQNKTKKEVTLNDVEKFKKVLKESDKQYLTAKEIKEYITLNGGHTSNNIDEQCLNIQDVHHGLTALHYLCCWNDTINIIKEFIVLGADPFIPTTKFFTLTFREKDIKAEAAKSTEEQVSTEGFSLKNTDANIEKVKHDLDHAQRARQFREFLDAIRRNDIEVINALLEHVDVNGSEPTNKITPLHHAAIHSSQEVVEILLAAGADPELMVDGETASQWAEANERPDNAKLIEEARLKKQEEIISNSPKEKLNRKGLSNISLDRLVKLLGLSDNKTVGLTVDDGGCGFDALAQCLGGNHTEKSLRMMCHQYYLGESKKEVDIWITKLGSNNPNVGTPYLLVQYTGDEFHDPSFVLQGEPTWFVQEIDGRILCRAMPEILPNGIHVIEITTAPESVGHYLISKEGYIQITDENRIKELDTLPTLIVCDRHFVPILSRDSFEIPKSQTKEENIIVSNTDNLNQNQLTEKVREIYPVPLNDPLGVLRVSSEFPRFKLAAGTTPLILATLLNNEQAVEVILQEIPNGKAGIIYKDATGHTAIYYAYIKRLDNVLTKMLSNYHALNYFFSGLEGESADNNFLENLSKDRIDFVCDAFNISPELAMNYKKLPFDNFRSSIQNNLFTICFDLRKININLPEMKNPSFFTRKNSQNSTTLLLNSKHLFTMINSKNYDKIQHFLRDHYKSLWLQTDESEISPFHFLCYFVSYEQFDINLFKKVFEFVKDEIKSSQSKRTALWYAILFGSIDAVELLLENEAPIGLTEQLAALLYPGKNNTILHLIGNKCLKLEKQSAPVPAALTVPSQPIAIPQVRQSQQRASSTPMASSSLRWSLSLPTPRSSLIADEGNKELSAFSKNLTTYIQQWIHFSPGLKEPVKQKLAANVNIFGYQFLKISGEGNCFFEAVLNQLIDDNNFSNFTAQTLLNTMINHIIKYENNYQNHLTDDLGKFIKELQQNPSQIGVVFIMALSRALKINIAIIQSDNEDPIIIKQNNSIKTILLCCGFNRYCPLLIDSTKNKDKDLDTLISQVEPDEFDLSVGPQQTANLVL